MNLGSKKNLAGKTFSVWQIISFKNVSAYIYDSKSYLVNFFKLFFYYYYGKKHTHTYTNKKTKRYSSDIYQMHFQIT